MLEAVNQNARHSRTTAMAGVVGLQNLRWEIRHWQIIKEDNRSFGVFYVSQKI
jgi:hypothetical protein